MSSVSPRWFCTTVLFHFLFSIPAALADFGEYQAHRHEGQMLIVKTSIGELTVRALGDAALEVYYQEDAVKQLPSFAIAGEPDPVRSTVRESDVALELSLPGLTAVVSKSPVRIEFLRDGEPLIMEEHGYYAHETMRGFRFELDDGEKIIGGGQRVFGMDRRGRRMPLYNKAAYGYDTEDKDQMYYSLPAVLSSDKYIVVFDNSASGWLDIGATEDDVLEFQAVAGRTAYLIVAGDSYPDLIEQFTGVTGRQPLPPRWAFGNFASRFGYRTEKEARNVVRRFRRHDIPLDAIILDIYWFGPDIKGHMGNLDWDRNAFPTPEKMIADFAEDGVRTIAITEPFVLTTSSKWDSAVESNALAKNVAGQPRRFDFYFGNTGLIDVFDDGAETWFWQFYERLFEQGIAGTWGDLGEPEVHPGDSIHWLSDPGIEATGDEVHNAYGHEWARMVYENRIRKYPGVRPLIMMRSGFIGSQRYGMVPWTGDVSRSWGGLKPQVELSLQMGLLGLAYTHSDLGGFAGGEVFEPEMYIRWLQYGVFQPVYRPHAQEHIPAEPVFHDRRTRKLVREFIRLRYRLLPYNYTLAWQNSLSGMPLMRPLFFEDESDPSLIDEKDAYLWGDAFLVAPVTDPGITEVEVNVPDGVWFDFWSDRRIVGGGTVPVPVTIETIPVLVRAGSFVPMIDVIESTAQYSSEKLTLHYYTDADITESRSMMYDDDGESRSNLLRDNYEVLGFFAQRDDHSLTIFLRRDGGEYDGKPDERELTLVVHNWASAPDRLLFDDTEISISGRLPRRGPGAAFDAKTRRLTVRVTWDHAPMSLQID